ncbi:hypothetical protein [Actinomadura sp. NEAU-AAG7]|uniref:hypothetical protein n=1 Tax=Actinomadura sp. NEAU-AAG7 TaxID=2839640 RepID=UPI001BE4CBB6|nr:hypothetical protein [Actinomadura sp. NEAU-AAG7]MBT2211099.1 hypothetical protein [Actinomadura sp. NEAU-AAG7]
MHDEEILAEHFVFGVDIENYSGRSTRHQGLLQERLRSIIEAAADEAGLDPASWKVQGEGDGQYVALPAGADLTRVVGTFVRAIDDRLRLHNEDHSASLELRVRIAMHCDVFVPAAFGTAGPAFVEVARLLAAGPARQALKRDRDAALVLLVSREVFRKVVRSDLAALRERDFTEIQVSHPEKGYDRTAHMHLPHSRRAGDAPPPEAPPRPPPPQTPPPQTPAPQVPAPQAPAPQAPAPQGPPPGISFSGDGNRGIVLGNTAGRDMNIKIEEAPKADPRAEGMRAFRHHDYDEAAEQLRRAAAQATTPQDAAGLRFRLALALLHGQRPRLHRRPTIQRAERELGKVLALDPEHAGALLLWAIVKQDYYEMNGFDYTGPPPERMVGALVQAPLDRGRSELAAEIVEHVPAWDNPIWSTVRMRIRPAEDG